MDFARILRNVPLLPTSKIEVPRKVRHRRDLKKVFAVFCEGVIDFMKEITETQHQIRNFFSAPSAPTLNCLETKFGRKYSKIISFSNVSAPLGFAKWHRSLLTTNSFIFFNFGFRLKLINSMFLIKSVPNLRAHLTHRSVSTYHTALAGARPYWLASFRVQVRRLPSRT